MTLEEKIAAVKEFISHYYIDRDKVQLGFSGGKDSTACYLLLLELGIDFLPAFADTDNEHPWTVEFANNLHHQVDGPEVVTVKKAPYTAERWQQKRDRLRVTLAKDHTITQGKRRGEIIPGFPEDIVEEMVSFVRPSGNMFLDLCIIHGMFPLRRSQFCTQELKLEPAREQIIIPWLEQGYDVVSVAGIRSDESRVRATYAPFEQDLTKEYVPYMPTTVYRWNPILDWTWEDVFAMHKRHNVDPNPLYSKGMGRVGCMPCIHATKPEIRQIAMRFPEQLERIAEWEEIMGKISRWVRHTGDPIGFMNGTVVPTGNLVHQKIEWAFTGRGDNEKDLIASDLEAPACSSKYGLCE